MIDYYVDNELKSKVTCRGQFLPYALLFGIVFEVEEQEYFDRLEAGHGLTFYVGIVSFTIAFVQIIPRRKEKHGKI